MQRRSLLKNTRVIIFTFVLLIIALLVGFFYQLRGHQLEQQLQIARQIEQAESDFSNGLMHIALSGNIDSPWQRQIGVTLLRQSLANYQKTFSVLPNSSNNLKFADAINQLTQSLNSLSTENTSLSISLRQNVFVMRKQAAELEHQLMLQLEHERLNQSAWFAATVLISVISLLLLFTAFIRSELMRDLLDSDLKLSEQRFFELLQNTDEVFWLESFVQQELVYVSPAFERFTNISTQTLLSSPQAWQTLVHKEDQKLLAKARKSAVFESQDIEFRFTPDKSTIRWIAARLFPIWPDTIKTKQAQPEYIGAVLRDVTQKRKYEHSLVQSQKMESLGQLTGGVAHDFNNLLTVILSNTQLLIPHLKSLPELSKTAELITRAAQRGASLNQQLLAFASKQQLHPKTISANALVEDSVSLLSRTLGEKYQLFLQQSEDDLWVKVDPGQFQNVLVNLCINSRDAMPQGGKISIRTNVASPKEARNVEGEAVKITVKDNGKGIETELINRVFDPFFTTKSTAKGTGLGLSMVYGFVRQSGGEISVNSKVGKGTTFNIILPLSEKESLIEDADIVQTSVCESTLLLVEDDEMVRESTAAALQNEGYKVMQASCAQDAKLLLDTKRDIALVLTDVVMPGAQDGYALAQYIETHFAHIKVLVMSGYIGNERHHLEHIPFLQKPFTNREVVDKVKDLLNRVAL